MKKLLLSTIGKVRGGGYKIDSQVPSGYLFGIMIQRSIMLIRGFLRFGRFGPACYLGQGVKLRCKSRIRYGKGLTVNQGCIIDGLSSTGVIFGKNVSIGYRTIIEGSGSLTFVGKGILVGDNVGIGPYSHIGGAGGVVIGNDTIMGNFVTIHPENHRFDNKNLPIRLQGVEHSGIRIGNNCWIGAKTMILDGAEIGDGCIIAGGSVVLKGNYEPDSVYGGDPARLIRKR